MDERLKANSRARWLCAEATTIYLRRNRIFEGGNFPVARIIRPEVQFVIQVDPVKSRDSLKARAMSGKLGREDTEARSRTCSVCGQIFCTDDLDQVFYHGPEPHTPLATSTRAVGEDQPSLRQDENDGWACFLSNVKGRVGFAGVQLAMLSLVRRFARRPPISWAGQV